MIVPVPVAVGLSPRVRGNPDAVGSSRSRTGSIPACAGEPDRWRTVGNNNGVYPRVCGGTTPASQWRFAQLGLSPRVRGNRIGVLAVDQDVWSIPACAGEPLHSWNGSPPLRVYPRVCGGTGVSSAMARSLRGLSPRVRGNHRHPLLPDRRLGSIPACAGEPRYERDKAAGQRVYPRVCGGTPNKEKER